MPMPFRGKEFTFTQPDGTLIMLRGWGNQLQAVFETLDGFTVVRNPDTGFFEYAAASKDGSRLQASGMKIGEGNPKGLGLQEKLRPAPGVVRFQAQETGQLRSKSRWEERRESYRTSLRKALARPGLLAMPPREARVGDYVGLCLLIEFPDDPGAIPLAEVESFCNQKGYQGFGNNGSVFDYFYDNSQGKLRYTNVTTAYYRAQHRKRYYADPNLEYGLRAQELITEALTDLAAKGFNFQQLSPDHGGYVYAVNAFYAGRCINDWGQGLWPHSASLDSPLELGSGRMARDYQITNMVSAGGEKELSLGTFCHENGHMLCDFPDLYDYGDQSEGVGQYCLMCAGASYNEKNPTQICAYLKYKAGWAKKVTPISSRDSLEAKIAAGENDFFLFRGPISQEYFIIENRCQSGRDRFLPSAGLAIWHVDELGDNNNEQMTPTQHYECSLEQADNRFDLEGKVNAGDAGDLFNAQYNSSFGPATHPSNRWWDGTASGLEILNISAAGREMTFNTKGTP